MNKLDSELNQKIIDLELKTKTTLSHSEKELIKDGIYVGMHPQNTLDRALETVESRFFYILKEKESFSKVDSAIQTAWPSLSSSLSLNKG